MKETIKKAAMLIFAAMALTMGAAAQQQQEVRGFKALGASIYVGSGSSWGEKGLGGKFRYNIFDRVRAETQATFYIPENRWPVFDVSLNIHYVTHLGDRFSVYPLAGLGVNYFLKDALEGLIKTPATTRFSFNAGGGCDLQLAGNMWFNAEVSYRVNSWWDGVVISGGIVYKFVYP